MKKLTIISINCITLFVSNFYSCKQKLMYLVEDTMTQIFSFTKNLLLKLASKLTLFLENLELFRKRIIEEGADSQKQIFILLQMLED